MTGGKKVAVNYTFQRVEKKYMLTKEQYNEFIKEISPYMQADEYGLHTICNIYYDTDTDELIRASIEKPKYKEKLRLRSYGVPDENGRVFLEIKKKFKGTVFKRRVSMSNREAMDYTREGIKPGFKNQILGEIDYFMKFYKPVPKLFLAYDRVAYFGKENSEIRMTFDRNIRSRRYDLDLTKGDYGDRLTDDNCVLLEIKVPMAYPMWLSRILSRLEIYPISFSKYGNIYKEDIMQKRSMEECLQVY